MTYNFHAFIVMGQIKVDVQSLSDAVCSLSWDEALQLINKLEPQLAGLKEAIKQRGEIWTIQEV